MDLKGLEALMRDVAAGGGEGVREKLEALGLSLSGLPSGDELVLAAGSLAARRELGPTAPDDPSGPWY